MLPTADQPSQSWRLLRIERGVTTDLAAELRDRGRRLLDSGDIPRALEVAQRALEASERGRTTEAREIARGDLSEAESITLEVERALAPFRPRWPFPMIEVVRATTAMARGSYGGL